MCGGALFTCCWYKATYAHIQNRPRFFVSLFYLDWYAAARMTPSGFHQNQYLLSAMWGAARFSPVFDVKGDL